MFLCHGIELQKHYQICYVWLVFLWTSILYFSLIADLSEMFLATKHNFVFREIVFRFHLVHSKLLNISEFDVVHFDFCSSSDESSICSTFINLAYKSVTNFASKEYCDIKRIKITSFRVMCYMLN